jgi:hypothetical protein
MPLYVLVVGTIQFYEYSVSVTICSPLLFVTDTFGIIGKHFKKNTVDWPIYYKYIVIRQGFHMENLKSTIELHVLETHLPRINTLTTTQRKVYRIRSIRAYSLQFDLTKNFIRCR